MESGKLNSSETKRSGYRPDLDGLRGIAVAAVVAFHLGVPYARGGFVGVDVFFVISGYLIFGLLLREGASTGGVRLRHFFARRVRRLLPAFAVTMLLTGVFATTLYTVAELTVLARSSVAATAFAANYYFRAKGYFAEAIESQPLLHTWSLSVEEQFYLFAPLLVLLVARSARDVRRACGWLLTVVVIASFAINVSRVMGGSPASAFFLLPGRAWEIAIGGLCAVAAPAFEQMGTGARTATALAGVAAVAAAFILYAPAMGYPGYAAALPVMGAALLIVAGESGTHALDGVLTNRALVGVGLVSYPWYLLHWPFMTMLRVAQGPNPWRDVVVAAVTLAAAAAVYRWIERPVRRPGSPARPRVLIPVGLAMCAMPALAAGVATTIARSRPVPSRFAPGWEAVAAREVSPLRRTCTATEHEARVRLGECWLYRGAGRSVIVVWGDSHADAWAHMAADVARRRNLGGAVQLTKSSCPPLLGLVPVTPSIGADASCRTFNENVLAAMDSLRGEGYQVAAMLVARWPMYTGGGMYSSAGVQNHRVFFDVATRTPASALGKMRVSLLQTLDALRARGIPATIVLPTPELPFNAPACVLRWRETPTFCGSPRPAVDAYSGGTDRVLRAASGTLGVRLIEPAAFFCDAARCYAERWGRLLYYDDNHPSASAMAVIASMRDDLLAAPSSALARNPAAR